MESTSKYPSQSWWENGWKLSAPSPYNCLGPEQLAGSACMTSPTAHNTYPSRSDTCSDGAYRQQHVTSVSVSTHQQRKVLAIRNKTLERQWTIGTVPVQTTQGIHIDIQKISEIYVDKTTMNYSLICLFWSYTWLGHSPSQVSATEVARNPQRWAA